jgi:hypothetical protein
VLIGVAMASRRNGQVLFERVLQPMLSGTVNSYQVDIAAYILYLCKWPSV